MTLQSQIRKDDEQEKDLATRGDGSTAVASPTGSTAPDAGGTPHSPLPWAQEHRECKDGMYRTQVFDPSGAAICSFEWNPVMLTGGIIATNREANAAFLVQCVNSHQALIDALIEAADLLPDCDNTHFPDVIARVRAALVTAGVK